MVKSLGRASLEQRGGISKGSKTLQQLELLLIVGCLQAPLKITVLWASFLSTFFYET